MVKDIMLKTTIVARAIQIILKAILTLGFIILFI